jgi:hypothetical protein
MPSMLRRSALAFLVLVVLALPAGANGKKTDVAFGWAVADLPGGQKWIRFTNTDDEIPVRLASVHGISFDITSVVSVRASGAQTPSCTVSTAPTTFQYLYCNGELPPDSTLLVVVGTTGSGDDFEIAASDAVDPSTLQYAPDTDIGPLLPVTASLTKTPTAEQVTFTSGPHAYDEIEILPHGFTITKVNSIAPAGSECDMEGPGLDCTVALPANATGTVTFVTSDATSGTPTADVILSGEDGSGNAFVTQTQGPAATYDLLTKARPSVVTYKRGQKLAAHPIRFTVTNAGDATIPSSPATVTQTISGNATKLFRARLSCQPKIRTMPSLGPGKSANACTLALAPTRPIARKAGKLNLTVAVACTAPETSCANNRARATIVVK